MMVSVVDNIIFPHQYMFNVHFYCRNSATAITEIEQIMSLPEFSFSLSAKNNSSTTGTDADIQRATANTGGSSYADSLRLTEDDRVNVFVTYASLLSKGWVHFYVQTGIV